MKVKILFTATAIAITLMLDVATVLAASGTVTITSPTTGQNFNVGQAVTVSGDGTVTEPDTVSQYGVKISWGDSTSTGCLALTGTTGSFTYTTSPSNDHTYSSSVPETITVGLYHQCGQGAESFVASSTVSININPTSTTTTTSSTTTQTTTTTTTTTPAPTCGITATSPMDFGSLNPTDTSSVDVSTTITNTGDSNTTTLTIEGTIWSDGGSNIMPVTQTHWSLTPGQTYASMNPLHLSPGDSMGTSVGPATPLDVFFKLSIPGQQLHATYTQTVTFTGGC